MVEKQNFRNERFECEFMKDGLQTAGRRTLRGKHVAAGLVTALLLAFGMLAVPATSSARIAIGISVNFGPPALPVYAQPPCPGPGYIWTPGYWAYSRRTGYYWVPGAWVAAPFVGALWTPGYWGFSGGFYLWHPGYWGTRVGFYGGINYGFGYDGDGYRGGYWDHDRFFYNRAYNRLEGRRFDHVYFRRGREDQRYRRGRVSYYGGRHGMNARPTRGQINAEHFRRFGPVHQQVRRERVARGNPRQWASYNHNRGPAREFRGGPPQGRGGWQGRGNNHDHGRGHGGRGHDHGNGHDHGRGGRR